MLKSKKFEIWTQAVNAERVFFEGGYTLAAAITKAKKLSSVGYVGAKVYVIDPTDSKDPVVAYFRKCDWIDRS